MFRRVSFLKVLGLAFLFAVFAVMASGLDAGAAQLTLSWTDNSDDEDGFRIERKDGLTATYGEIAVVAANTVSYVDSSLVSAANYCYRLRAYNSAGASSYSNEQCATTASPPAPPTAANFLLTIAKAGSGSGTVTATGINCGADCTHSASSGTQMVLAAVAASGSIFTGWTGSGCASGTVTVTGHMTCTATFNLSSFTLTIAKAGTGSGTISTNGINCGSDCSESYPGGSSIALTATAASGSTFAGWSGTGCASTVSITGNSTCTATFNLNSYTVSVNKAGTGTGTVMATFAVAAQSPTTMILEAESGNLTAPMVIQSDPLAFGGQNVGIPEGAGNNYNSASFGGAGTVGFSIEIPKSGTYALWILTIAPDGSSDSFYVTGNGALISEWHATNSTVWRWAKVTNVALTAGVLNLAFRQREDGIKLDQLILTDDLSLIPGINCGSDCSESVTSGTQVAFKAAAASGSTFAGWTGAGCGSAMVTVASNMTCTATFNLNSFTLSVSKAGTGSGAITANGINCGSDCSESYTPGSSVTLTATAASGSTFAGWTGSGCASGTATLTGNMTCTATFNLNSFTLTISKAGSGSGTVTATGINCGADCTHSASSGTQMVLAAVAANGSTFTGWTGSGCASGTVALTGNMTCTATFNLSSFTLTISKAGSGSGTVAATGINCGADCTHSASSGTQMVLAAVAANGSTFTGWTGSGCASGTVTLTGNMTCTAIFTLNSFTLTVSSAGNGSGTVTAPGINCGGDCSQSFTSGTLVALTATAAAGSAFSGWSGTGCGSTITITRDFTCAATFNSVTISGDRIGIYRPSTGEWFLDSNADYSWDGGVDIIIQTFAATNSKPVVGDWRGTGETQLGLFQPATLQWHLDLNSNKAVDGCTLDACEGPFGETNDIAIAGKWTVRGNYRIGVFRPSTGYWYLDRNADGDFDRCRVDRCVRLKNYVTGDLPLVGDWSGDGITRLGLFRPSTGQWFIDRNGNRSWDGCRRDQCIDAFGTAGDLPVSGDWDGTGESKVGIWRPTTGQWFLDYNGNGKWDGCSVDVCSAGFGVVGDIPVVGKW